ncbi:MAG: deoxyribodipyrimidine photo-lyase/cryptochrome family protein [Burkholderiaceae bacterium]
MKPAVQVVWFKRDLRTHDHAALVGACACGPAIALYVYEPELLTQPDASVQHIAFANECLIDLQQQLTKCGIPLVTREGRMPEVLETLRQEITIAALWSHEETGNAASFARDERVGAWCKANSIVWNEVPSNGVVRRLKSRDVWSAIWMQRMAVAPLDAPRQSTACPVALASAGIGQPVQIKMQGHEKPSRQRGGRSHALEVLQSFLSERCTHYRYAMSSPLSAVDACSRLSAHLTFGTLSIREVVHAVWRARDLLLGLPPAQRPVNRLASLKSFESRLHWHCHFIQKLESDPSIESRNLHPAYDGLREQLDPALHHAWASGQTGVPMVDACMRMLAQHGWINFRMRAMLVSFASYHLWQPWQATALHLAREFLDYEPGIHYAQVQMQSGTTGINTIRIYNPVKQAHDQDPDGKFVRTWIPALARVPAPYIFEPWTMPRDVQQQAGCIIDTDYPSPVVDLEAAAKRAREAMWAVRHAPEFKQDASAIYRKHGSRNPRREGMRSKTAPAPSPQLSLQLELNEDG